MLSAADIARCTATVASSLDVPIVVKRRNSIKDGGGHTSDGTPTTIGTVYVNTFKPSGTQLQQFAGIIGSQKATMIRFLSTSDIKEGDEVDYDGLVWEVQSILYAESYTFCLDALITTTGTTAS